MSETDINETFSIHGRSHTNAQICLNNKIKSVESRQGYKENSLFPFIEFHNIVVDILHMTLRITDKLFGMLLFRLEELEDKKNRELTELFKNFLEVQCNITYPFVFTDTTTKLRTLNQNERLKILDKLLEINDDDSDEDLSDDDDDEFIREKKSKSRKKRAEKINSPRPLATLFPKSFQNDITLNRISDLCLKFRKILNIIKSEKNINSVKNLKKRLKKWLSIFIKIEPKITPYIHIFCYHIPEFIETHGNLNLFSMQGLENLNSYLKLNYFKQTNRNKNTFTKTLLEKINRIDFYQLGGDLKSSDQLNEIESSDNDDQANNYTDLFDFLNSF